jgi:nitrous oxide reductase accessory protein NosL
MKKRLNYLLLIPSLLLFFAQAAYSADNVNPIQVRNEDKCPVCGMFVAKYRHWIAEIVFKDGSYAAFDGPKDMFKYYLDIPRYTPARKASDIAGIYVTEYYSAKLMDAKKMFYVTGSNVLGPMGEELIPLSGEAEAMEFMRDHKGSGILKFQEVTERRLK